MTGSPSWADIAVVVRARIVDGTYPVGGLLPSTTALAAGFGVSPGPIQRAIAALKAEGLVVGEPGRGVRVVRTPEAGTKTVEEQLAEHDARLRRIEERLGMEMTGLDAPVSVPPPVSHS
jgi:GntR family transcriptional regulator